MFFSEGIDYDINDVFDNRDATTIIDSTRDAIAAATRANVSIYGIDVRGLGAGLDDNIEIQSFPDDPSLGLGLQGAVQRSCASGRTACACWPTKPAASPSSTPTTSRRAFQRVVDENSSYYVLGYYPANDRRDGRFRKIEVHVANRPGRHGHARGAATWRRAARAQEAKLAGPNDATPELREAMSSPIPVSVAADGDDGERLQRAGQRTASVVISTLIGGRDLPLVEKDGMFKNDLEVAHDRRSTPKGKVFRRRSQHGEPDAQAGHACRASAPRGSA